VTLSIEGYIIAKNIILYDVVTFDAFIKKRRKKSRKRASKIRGSLLTLSSPTEKVVSALYRKSLLVLFF
jgi:hypothetical protein